MGKRARGKSPDPDAVEGEAGNRKCLVSGRSGPREGMIRFVLDPDSTVTPDLAETLPGRGMWLSADAGTIKTACDRKLFAKAAKAKVEVPGDLPERLTALLARRATDLLSLARRAGEAVAGFEKVEATLRQGKAAVLLQAIDGAEDGRRKLAALATRGTEDVAVYACLTGDEMGQAFGRDHAVHVSVAPGGLSVKLRRECARLAGLRPQAMNVDREDSDSASLAGEEGRV